MAQQHYRTPFKKALLQFITEPDPYLSMLQWVTTEMMRIEARAKVGAAKGKHARERTTYFSGARARRVDTRLGTVYLLVPKVRKGGYIPFFISERRRSEQALIAVVQEAFVNGVSTRKIERLARAMGIENISASQVEEGLEDSLSFYDFPEVDKKRISSTNGQERLNMEIRRRSRVVGVFPSVESYVRLTICYLIEYAGDWGNERSYIREDKVLGSLDRLHELMVHAAN